MLDEEEYLNKNIDFTFNYNYRGTGKWDRNSHTVTVSDEISTGVNDDNIHLTSKEDFYKAQDAEASIDRIDFVSIDGND